MPASPPSSPKSSCATRNGGCPLLRSSFRCHLERKPLVGRGSTSVTRRPASARCNESSPLPPATSRTPPP
eukprot:6270154-Prymnesium_polylepis.1